MSLDGPACDMVSSLGCDFESTPARFGVRNVPAGDYRVVVADELGFQGNVQALVRPTVAPTIIPPGHAETCAEAVDASSGGLLHRATRPRRSRITAPGATPRTSPPAARRTRC